MRVCSGSARGRSIGAVALAAIVAGALSWQDIEARQQASSERTDLARAYFEAKANGWNFLPGRAIVKFRSTVTFAGRHRALSALRGQPAASSLAWIGDRAVVRDEVERDARILVQRLREQPEVELAELDYIRRVPTGRAAVELIDRDDEGPRPAATPNDSQYGSLQWNFPLIDLPRAWDVTPGGSDAITVAVVDTGMTTAASTQSFRLYTGSSIQTVSIPFGVSPDFSSGRMVLARDFIFNTATGSPVLDMDGHGTHVAGTIAQDTNNGLRVAGIAYNVRIMPVKACVGYWELMIQNAEQNRPGFLVDRDESICTTSAVSQGVRYAADNGAQVINLSLGGTSGSTSERDAIAYAVSKGAFVSISAGNDYEDGNPVTYPASYAASIDGAMSVGAIGKSLGRSYYSTSGSFVEIAAPGGDARSPGSGDDLGRIWQATLSSVGSSPNLAVPNFTLYATVGYQGTSMAAPHVAGLAALIMSQGVRDPRAVEKIIRATARDLGPAGKDNEFGYGLIQARAAVFGVGVRK